MKILKNQCEGWGNKVNFVDQNNVMVGYDMSQDCCEYADWFMSYEIPKKIHYDTELQKSQQVVIDEKILDRYVFDITKIYEIEDNSCLDDGGAIVFKLIGPGKGVKYKPLFLTLFNIQNGYYGHGFKCEIGGRTIYEGAL